MTFPKLPFFFFFLSPSYRSFCFLPAMGMEITLTRENSKWTLRNHLVLFHEIMPPLGPEGNPPKAIQSITSPYEWERLPNVCSVSPQLCFKPLTSCPVHSSLFLLSLLHSFTYYHVSSPSSLIQTKHTKPFQNFPIGCTFKLPDCSHQDVLQPISGLLEKQWPIPNSALQGTLHVLLLSSSVPCL